jgi:hypothetical protein
MDDLVIWSDLDEIILPRSLEWVRANPPAHFYRFLGEMFFYSYRWRCPDPWQWAYIMRYGSKRPERNWFQYRTPDNPPFEYVPRASLLHCSYCFPKLGLIIEKLRSFSHLEFAQGQYIDHNYVYAYAFCGYSMFGGNYSLVLFDPMGIDFPNDSRFDFLKMSVGFEDLDEFRFDVNLMRKYAPCELPFLVDGELPAQHSGVSEAVANCV